MSSQRFSNSVYYHSWRHIRNCHLFKTVYILLRFLYWRVARRQQSNVTRCYYRNLMRHRELNIAGDLKGCDKIMLAKSFDKWSIKEMGWLLENFVLSLLRWVTLKSRLGTFWMFSAQQIYLLSVYELRRVNTQYSVTLLTIHYQIFVPKEAISPSKGNCNTR